LSAWSAEPVTVDRRTSSTVHVPMAAVSVTGTVQPEVLRRVLSRDLRENGLAARLLLAMPPRRPSKWTDRDISPAAEDALAGVVARLLTLQHGIDSDGNAEPVAASLTAEAREAFIAWHDEHEQALADEVGDLAAAMAKLRGYCARLALVMQLARWAAGEADADAIDAASVASAVALVRWFEHEQRRIYAALDEDELACERRKLVDWIESRGDSVTVRDLTHGMRRYRGDRAAAERDLEALAEAGAITREYPAGSGRPTARYRVVTGVTVTKTPRHDSASKGNNGDGDSGDTVTNSGRMRVRL
jgi:DNA-binding transcriptional ArsR family regulator